jgi:hypothetical protein
MATRQEILSELAVVERELAEAERELQRLNALFVEQTDPAAIRIISQQIEQVSRTRNTLINRKTQLQRQLNSADAAVTTSTPTYSTASDTPGVIAAGGAVTPGAVPGPTTAQPTPTAANGAVAFGTDGRVLPTSVSQAPAGNTVINQGQSINRDDAEAVQPSGNQVGVGARSDDSQKNTVQTRVDTLYSQNQTVLPKPNILDKYASYTYNISVYLMSPERYKDFITGNISSFEPNTLLFQSGGAPPAQQNYSYSGPEVGLSSGIIIRELNGPSRNPYFSQDFFIDNVEIKNIIMGKGQGSAHNSALLNFTVTEYNGITLLQNLDRAVVDYIYKGEPRLKLALQQNPDLGTWGSQIYMMAIRFYGYDDNGNLVFGGTNTPEFKTDPQAVVEKYIPFVVRNITFKVGNRAVEYQWDCATPATMVNTGPNSATVPYNCQLSGKSLADALGGNLETVFQPVNQREAREPNTSAPPRVAGGSPQIQPAFSIQAFQATPPRATTPVSAPPKADAAKSVTETVTQGLMAAMNRYQQEIFSLGQIQIPNRYSIEFTSTALSDAKLTYRGRTDRDLVPAANNNNPRNLLPETQSVDTDKKTFSVTAGQQLVQVIEMLVRNSTYISDQQLVIIDPVTGTQTPNPGRTKNLAWFKINMTASPIGYDFKRKDYAWDIKYIISEYRIVVPETGYFPIVDFPGFHKSYPYWFTGENTAIISFEQKYNYQYSRVLSGGLLTDTTSASYQDFTKTVFYPRSGQSTQGGPLRTNEAAANLADYFYSPGDQKTVELEIIGDPAWIFQGEASGSYNLLLANNNPFLPDGTINVDYGQIFFEISWNSPEDYDVNGNGLINPAKNYTQAANAKQNAGVPKQSYAYGARTCTSVFRRGSFTQVLDGYLVIKNLNTKVNADNQRQIAAASDQQLISRVSPDINRELNERADRQLIARVQQPVNKLSNAGLSSSGITRTSEATSPQQDPKTNQVIAREE